MGVDPITAAVGGGLSLLGGIAGSQGGGGGTTTAVSEPWSKQQPYLLDAFKAAQDLYNAQKNNPYQPHQYAGMTDLTKSGITGIGNFANGAGADAANSVLNTVNPLTSGYNGLLTGANKLLNFNPTDPTQANIAAAGAYANNPYMNGMVDAASRDVTRNLGENILPGIDRNAVGTGNENSTRTGIAQGIAMRGAQDTIGDISAQLRGTAYQNGLATAEGARQANQSALLDAMKSGTTQYGDAVGLGYTGAQTGSQLGYNNYDALTRAGQLQQQDAQGAYDNTYTNWQNATQYPWTMLQNYYGIIGGNNWGGTTNTTAPKTGGGLQGFLGGAAGGLGLYSQMKTPVASGGWGIFGG